MTEKWKKMSCVAGMGRRRDVVNVFMYVLDEETFPMVLNRCMGVLHTDGGRQSWVLCYPWCGTVACTIGLVQPL